MDSTEAAYASLVEGMDKSLGDLMDFLKEKNIDRNTIIIFMSDNGGLSNAGRGGKRNTHNLPLRAGKGSLYEGGIRIPMIVKWPGVTKMNSRAKQYIIAEDFFPTVLQITGIADNEMVKRDGKSYVPVLKNPFYTDTARSLIFHYPNRWTSNEDEAISWTCAIRKGAWKLVYLMKQKKLELYNLSTDIGEKNNLALVYPEQLAKLATLLGNELRQRAAQMPIWKETGKPVAWPDELLPN
jgi:arylsulfatase A-like enzyme